MTESTPQALDTLAINLSEDVKKDTPGVIVHIESFGHWSETEIKLAIDYLKTKL